MKMSRVNAVLTATLLAQLVWIGVCQLSPEPAGGAGPLPPLVEGLRAADVQRIEVSGCDKASPEQVTVERAGEAWTVRQAHGYPADPAAVQRNLSALLELRPVEVVSTSGLHHRDLKVADDACDKRVILEGAGKKIELFVGSGAIGGATHVRRADDDAVYAVRGFDAWRVSARSEDWVERRFFAVSAEQVVGLELRNPKGELRLKRAPGGWALEGGAAPIDAGEVDGLLSRLASLSLSAVAGKAGDPGLDLAQAEVELRLHLAAPRAGEDGGTEDAAAATPAIAETRTLRLTAKPGDDGRVLARADDQPFVVEVGKWSVEKLLEATAQSLAPKAAE